MVGTAAGKGGMRLEVVRHVAADIDRVWAVLTAWERQPEWMLDAKAVEVLTPARHGVGVTLRCPTNLLGMTVQDVMRVTGWEPPWRLEVTHLGTIITGVGAFELVPDGDRATELTWWEQIDPPLGRIGAAAAVAALPVLRWVFGRSLANLAALAEAEAGHATWRARR